MDKPTSMIPTYDIITTQTGIILKAYTFKRVKRNNIQRIVCLSVCLSVCMCTCVCVCVGEGGSIEASGRICKKPTCPLTLDRFPNRWDLWFCQSEWTHLEIVSGCRDSDKWPHCFTAFLALTSQSWNPASIRGKYTWIRHKKLKFLLKTQNLYCWFS